jgi:hypothetical protein
MFYHGLSVEKRFNEKPNLLEAMKYYKISADGMFHYEYEIEKGYKGKPNL